MDIAPCLVLWLARWMKRKVAPTADITVVLVESQGANAKSVRLRRLRLALEMILSAPLKRAKVEEGGDTPMKAKDLADSQNFDERRIP